MDEYLAYSRRVEVLNRSKGGTMFLMPLVACIYQKIVPRVCTHDFAKLFEEITENNWRDYFLSAREAQELDLASVTKAMASLKMDMKIRDAESRVGRLLDDFYDKLEQLDVAHLPEQERQQSVKILRAAIRPSQLKATVERQLTREANKAYKSDVKSFCRWSVNGQFYVAGTLVIANLKCWVAAAPLQDGLGDLIVSRDVMAKLGYCPRSLLLNARRAQSVYDLDQLGGKDTPNIWQRLLQQWTCPVQDSAKYERKKATCLKRGSENNKVVNCPNSAPGESERLLKEQMVKCERARNKKVTKLQGSANKSLGREAKIEGIDRAGVEVNVISPEPTVIQPYGLAPALKADRQVQFKLVTLDTPCGSLALRGLKAWVDSSSNAAELLISRAVMEGLGFSEDEFFSDAFAKQEAWDVSATWRSRLQWQVSAA
ncbi:hypothetical protein DYB28_000086 [Aphanomyces astaci]|uniref:Uncharacterized protein n=2 Tax=Aphanomyces astaci TaxID=112090 RepID=A0A9X8HDR4_APHAT|nr:hypothetical protein DYB28_000086 [Aphanomyces astaci]